MFQTLVGCLIYGIILPTLIGIILNHYKEPKGFERCSLGVYAGRIFLAWFSKALRERDLATGKEAARGPTVLSFKREACTYDMG